MNLTVLMMSESFHEAHSVIYLLASLSKATFHMCALMLHVSDRREHRTGVMNEIGGADKITSKSNQNWGDGEFPCWHIFWHDTLRRFCWRFSVKITFHCLLIGAQEMVPHCLRSSRSQKLSDIEWAS